MAVINAGTTAEVIQQVARIERILLEHEVRLRPVLRREILKLWRRYESLDVALREFEQNIQSILERRYELAAKDLSKVVDDQLQENGSQSVAPVVLAGLAAFYLSRSQGAAQEIVKTERDNIAARASIWAEEGLSQAEISSRLREIAPEYSLARIDLIAETEVRAVADELTEKSIEESGLEFTRKKWVTVNDNRVREDHRDADGQIVDIDATFTVGGEQLRRPRDPRGSAKNVLRCRCVANYLVD